MATDPPAMAVNGSYAGPSYDVADQSYDASRNAAATSDYVSPEPAANATSGNGTSANNSDTPRPAQDEIGWYFVEQYYTTLSKSPEKLFLFYNKSSQFVSGTETEKAPVCVGQKAINERIKELDIQDCKVRVTNVDSQGSQSNIVIQVIGEISNKSAPQRKFTQTFVLAEQANGYFVLNDIFRYLLDEEEEFGAGEGEAVDAPLEATSGYQEASGATIEPEAQVAPAATDEAALASAPKEVIVAETESVALDEAGIPPTAEVIRVEEAPAAVVTAAAAAAEEPAVPEKALPLEEEEVAAVVEATVPPALVEEEVSVEKPSESQVATAVAPAQSVTEAAPKPKTWANLLRSNVTPAVPVAPAAAASSSSVTARPAPTVQTTAISVPTATAAATSITPQDSDQAATPQSSGSEWQTAGPDHGKKQSRTQVSQTPADNQRGYIKNVNEGIDIDSLTLALTKVAEITYIDINRQKNCAFVDFKTPADYQAAVAANPHDVAGERIYVEERRVRNQGPYPSGAGPRGNNNNNMRGSPRPGNQQRGAFNKDGGRGNYGPRGRGNVGARGRGGVSQTT